MICRKERDLKPSKEKLQLFRSRLKTMENYQDGLDRFANNFMFQDNWRSIIKHVKDQWQNLSSRFT